MTRLLSEHFNPQGQPKRKFTSRQEAETWLIDKGLWDKFDVYHCSFCGKWHLASVKSDGD